MTEKIKRLFIKYKEIIVYLIVGVLTTIVSWACMFFVNIVIFGNPLHPTSIQNFILSFVNWSAGVAFAYPTNRIFVFESKTKTIKEFLKEMISFFLARVLSGILCDVGTFAVMVRVFKINDIFSKIVTQVMVVILNYILSKFVVFKKENKA